eukprot:SM000039S14498  [mRNA]  locus=s39:415140:416664:- [translate_table: standard]
MAAPRGCGGAGACILSDAWQRSHRSLAAALEAGAAGGYRLKTSAILPDVIFNTTGVSMAFIILADWSPDANPEVWERVAKMSQSFQRSYVVVAAPGPQRNSEFNKAYFRHCKSCFGKTPFVLVADGLSAIAKVLRLVHVQAECKRQGTMEVLGAEASISEQTHKAAFPACIRQELVKSPEAIATALLAVPSLDGPSLSFSNNVEQGNRTALHMLDLPVSLFYVAIVQLLQAFGSIEAIASAGPEMIVSRTGMRPSEAEKVAAFFRDDQYNRTPQLN